MNMNLPVSYRKVGDTSHFLNYTTGRIMSFTDSDANFLINNLERLQNDSDWADIIDQEVRDFFSENLHKINSRRFRPSLLELGMTFSFPTIVNVELNRRCSLTCHHCYIPVADLKSPVHSFFESLSDEKVQDLLSSLCELGIFLIVLTGGEVFLNKRLQFFLQETSKRNLIVEIFSNLQFLPDWFENINPYETKVGRIQTSIYSVVPEVHDQIVQHKGAFQNTLNNLLTLRAKGYHVEIATPLMSLNFDGRYETEKFFMDLDIPHSFAWPIVNEYYDPQLKSKSSLNISKEQFLQFCLEKPDFLIEINPLTNGQNSICAAGKSLFAISADGSVFPCSQYPKLIGNVALSNLKQLFNSSEMAAIRNSKMLDIPEDSYKYNYCMGNNFSETGDPFKQADFIKNILDYYEKHTNEAKMEMI